MTPLGKEKENRIIRGIGLVFLLQDINQLDKYGYQFLCQCLGFIAHYNKQGFIQHYGNEDKLKRDVVLYVSLNQCDDYQKGDYEYEFMMQKKRIYNTVLKISRGGFDSLPADEDCYKPPKISSLATENDCRRYIEDAFRRHLTNGSYVNLKDIDVRVKDLADATIAYSEAISSGMGDNEFMNEEYLFSIGQSGSVASLLDVYREEVWELFNSLSGRALELDL